MANFEKIINGRNQLCKFQLSLNKFYPKCCCVTFGEEVLRACFHFPSLISSFEVEEKEK